MFMMCVKRNNVVFGPQLSNVQYNREQPISVTRDKQMQCAQSLKGPRGLKIYISKVTSSNPGLRQAPLIACSGIRPCYCQRCLLVCHWSIVASAPM